MDMVLEHEMETGVCRAIQGLGFIPLRQELWIWYQTVPQLNTSKAPKSLLGVFLVVIGI